MNTTLPVDSAVIVPINTVPLVDDTDYKTIEDALTYDQAGLALKWNFLTTAGVLTQTAVTPTESAGDYDWQNKGGGMYGIEIPASGGASINNDTEGYGWFTGYATGVLPWRGPTITFAPANVVDSMVTGIDYLQIDVLQVKGSGSYGTNFYLACSNYSATRGLAGTALPDAAADAAGGLPISDAGGLDMDAILADTNELQTDWADGGRLDLLLDDVPTSSEISTEFTTLKGATWDSETDTIEDVVDHVSNLASGSAAISTTAKAANDGFVITTGAAEANDEDSTNALDGTTHDLEDDGGTTDCYYVFDVGANGVPTSVSWNGYVNSQGDSYAVYAYHWSNAAWQQVGAIAAANGSTVIEETFQLTNAHVGTGANRGLVHFRFYSTDGTKLATDRILCNYAVVSQSVGYADGAIWVDTNASNTNTAPYYDGVADNPVSTWAAALSLSSSLGVKKFHIAGGSSITLTADSSNYEIYGHAYDLSLNGQTITNANIVGARVTGTGVVSGTAAVFEYCGIGAATLGPSRLYQCGIGRSSGTFTAGSAGQFVLVDCFSLVPGSGTPSLVFSGTGSTTGVNIRGWKGGTNITLDSDCTMSLEVLAGGGQTVVTGGASVEIRGTCRSVSVTLTGGEQVQFVGVTGPLAIDGAGASSTVNLYGVSSSLSNTATGSPTVTDYTTATQSEIDSAFAALNDPTAAVIAAAVWELAGKIDGKTPQQALQYIAAVCGGILSGAGTGTETVKGLDGVTDRAQFTVDASGNRTAVSYDP